MKAVEKEGWGSYHLMMENLYFGNEGVVEI